MTAWIGIYNCFNAHFLCFYQGVLGMTGVDGVRVYGPRNESIKNRSWGSVLELAEPRPWSAKNIGHRKNRPAGWTGRLDPSSVEG